MRPTRTEPWWASPLVWVEALVVANIAFLAVDITLAHAINAFAHWAEWIPIGFSLTATPLLLLAMRLGGVVPALAGEEPPGHKWRARIARWIGLAVGWGAVTVGVAGLIWHLKSDFFQHQTLKNLVYTAPFAAPLAYSGLGLLLILNRMVASESLDWARWVILLAAGGFAGNFALCLADHAQNGFFYPTEWIGVVSSAIAVGFLIGGFAHPESRPLITLNLAIMAGQVAVGGLGFVLHIRGSLANRVESLWDTIVYGAPMFAPLLFCDLALLATLGLWAQSRALARAEGGAFGADPALASSSGGAGRLGGWLADSGGRGL